MAQEKIASKLFKYRSYTPIPFLLLMIFYENANIWSLIGGSVIVAAGEFLRLWGVSWAGSETRTTGTVGGTFLIVSGPFAHVRNPLYVGNILIYTGLGIMSFALFPYLQIAGFIFFSWQYYEIVKKEEGYLRETFGEQYKIYSENVPRFIPRLSAYKVKDVVQPPYNFKAGMRSERRSFQAIVFVMVTVVLLWFIGRV